MDFVFLKSGLWFLLVLPTLCLWSLSAQGETSIWRTGSANRCVPMCRLMGGPPSDQTGCVTG